MLPGEGDSHDRDAETAQPTPLRRPGRPPVCDPGGEPGPSLECTNKMDPRLRGGNVSRSRPCRALRARKTAFDAIGKMIDAKPLKPQYIAHLVDAVNREMENLERNIQGEAANAGGAVHVRAHSRRAPVGAQHEYARGDSPARDGKVAIADYWRAAP